MGKPDGLSTEYLVLLPLGLEANGSARVLEGPGALTLRAHQYARNETGMIYDSWWGSQVG